ncbi:MAG TPA: FecR domain-containing protein, partial [Polyangia bacterium]
ANRPARRRLGPLGGLVGAGAALAAVAVAVVTWRRGDALPTAVVAHGEGLAWSLADGSGLRLSPGARFTTLSSTSSSFAALLESGRGEFDVKPAGARRWRIDCGLAVVEVADARFACAREAAHLDLEVTRGEAWVRGATEPGRVRHLGAGQTLRFETVRMAPEVAPASFRVAAPEPPPAEASAPVKEARPVAATPDEAWRELARRGRHREAYAVLGARGVRAEVRALGVSDLLALADVARLSGHPSDAVAPLERVLQRFPGDAQAPLAAFELGRLQLDTLGRVAPGILALEKALSLGVPAALREDVEARLADAYLRAGDARRAQTLAEAYVRAHPAGRHLRRMQDVLRSSR